MQPLDLRSAPPRPPRDETDGIVFLPRSIDKARATLPGGDTAGYTIAGLTAMMLGELGISEADFIATVRDAATDADVAAYVHAHAKPGGIDAWTAFANARVVLGGDMDAAMKIYPWLPERPDLRLSLDVLAEDDRRAYATGR